MPFFRDMRLRDIKPRHVDEWFTTLPEGAPSNSLRYYVLTMIMTRALKEGEITSSPAMTEGVGEATSKPRPTWSWHDFWTLYFSASDDQERALLWVLAGSGARIGEALALNWEDVDFSTGEITVSKRLVDQDIVPGTKGHPKQIRALTMPQKALDALRTHLEASTGLPTDPVFQNTRGARLSYYVARNRLASLRRASGLDDFHPHDLRHLHLTTYAQHATQAETMARGGHTGVRTNIGYQHATQTRDRAVIAMMESAL